MCCRYYVDVELPQDILRIIMGSPDVRVNIADRSGDIHPSESAPVVLDVGKENGYKPDFRNMFWGFPAEHKDGQLVINARAESVLDRSMFAESVLSRRCIVPARHFYEWDASKNKYICAGRGGKPLLMAGIYKRCAGEEHFTILTTAANKSMSGIHERMPLILREGDASDWLTNGSRMFELLKTGPEELVTECTYEQLSLFD